MSTPTVSNQMSARPYYVSSTDLNLTISHLPPEAIHGIFSYLGVIDLRARTPTVCQQWYHVSKEYLQRAEREECKRIRESAEFLSTQIQEFISWNNFDTNKENYLISKKNALLALAEPTDLDKNKISCSLKLRNQLINQLTDLDQDDLFTLGNLTEGHHADDLMWIAKYILVFNSCKQIEPDNIVEDDDGKMWVPDEYKVKRFSEICYCLIACKAFDKALTFVSEIQTQNSIYTNWAQQTQEAVFATIAKNLTQHGYISQALAIADKDIYPDMADRNLAYKRSVLKSIREGLSNINFLDRIWEIARQIVKESCLANPDFFNLRPEKYARGIHSLGDGSNLSLLKLGSKGMLYSEKWLQQVKQEHGFMATVEIGEMRNVLSDRAIGGELIMVQFVWNPNKTITIESLEKTPDNLISGYALTLSALVYHELMNHRLPTFEAALGFTTRQLASNHLFLSASTSLDRDHFKSMWLECIETIKLLVSELVVPVEAKREDLSPSVEHDYDFADDDSYDLTDDDQ